MKPTAAELKIVADQLIKRHALVEYSDLVVEGLLLTRGSDGDFNLSPMGIRYSRNGEMILLRPFKSSRSYRNLKHFEEAVFHITDNVDLIARAAVAKVSSIPSITNLKNSSMCRLADTCRWYYLRVTDSDETEMRATFDMRIVERGHVRDFVGFNRAKFAVVEAAIYATRVGILPQDEILQQLSRLEPLVEKTGGQQERLAFKFVKESVEEALKDQEYSPNGFPEPSTGQ